MKRLFPWKTGILLLAGAAILFAAPAFANPDVLYPNSASWTVNSVDVNASVSNTFSSGANGSTTLNVDVAPGDAVSITVTWVIRDDSAVGGGDTVYNKAASFTPSTTSGPESVTVAAMANCTVTSSASTCVRTVSFTAPLTAGAYELLIDVAQTPSGGPGGINTRDLTVNFTVTEASAEKLDTTLFVDPQCFLLHAGDVDLTATLTETDSGDPISGADIDFYIDPPSSSIGTAVTDGSGLATLMYNINSLGVGDYNLYAEFTGDALYIDSNDSKTLGISYLFLGFGEPINGDGTSIFGGRIIPVKIRLVDANGDPVTDAAPTVWLTSYDTVNGVGEVLEQVSSVSAADTGNIMRYSADDRQYIYNWDARDLENGTYAVVVVLGDSPTCRAENPYAVITVAKKSGKK